MQNGMLTNGQCDTDIDLVRVAPFLIFDRNENDHVIENETEFSGSYCVTT